MCPPFLSEYSISTQVGHLILNFRFRKENEDVFYLEQLQDMSKSGAIGRVSLRHLRLANGRYRAFIDVDGMQFSTQPTDFVQYTDAYEEAARRACLHFESRQ